MVTAGAEDNVSFRSGTHQVSTSNMKASNEYQATQPNEQTLQDQFEDSSIGVGLTVTKRITIPLQPHMPKDLDFSVTPTSPLLVVQPTSPHKISRCGVDTHVSQ